MTFVVFILVFCLCFTASKIGPTILGVSLYFGVSAMIISVFWEFFCNLPKDVTDAKKLF